ncbi:MAG: dipicolinate synthase subunit DpsA [Actinomycetota bacterium]
MSVWQGLTVAFVGGDARETEMAVLASQEGALVRVFGAAHPPGEQRLRPSSSLSEALAQARVAIMPVPLIAQDGSIYAPHAPAKIIIETSHLEAMAADGHVVIGKANARLEASARAAGVTIHEYESDTELMLLRAPAIAEGAVGVAIERSPVTIHNTDIGVVGFGRIGQVLTRALLALGARVHVFARRAEARAAAYALAATPHALEEASEAFATLEVLYSTVPAHVGSRELLACLPRGALVVDLAAPPGSIDLEAAADLGLDGFWARGLGASAPRTVGRSQWSGVTRIIEAALAR